jgi:N-acetyl-gamma-glutamyl-phosphate reductase
VILGEKIKVGVVGPGGYTGRELLRILANHPFVEVVEVYGHESRDLPLKSIHPFLPGETGDLKIKTFGEENLKAEVYFLCVPHGTSARYSLEILKSGKKVIDLSADFRLRELEEYRKYYGADHPAPELLKKAVYGMPEFRKEEIARAELVANPGCLARTSLLALLPFVARGAVDFGFPVVIDVKTGVSGAGKKPRADLHFPEMNEDFRPYAPLKHRHVPEIVQESVEFGAPKILNLLFVPHLIPIDRGILASVYFRLRDAGGDPDLHRIIYETYKKSPFVRVLRDEMPSLKRVRGSNMVEISAVNSDEGYAVVFAALDNLVSGASGTAVHNFNVMFGLEEGTGLSNLLPL